MRYCVKVQPGVCTLWKQYNLGGMSIMNAVDVFFGRKVPEGLITPTTKALNMVKIAFMCFSMLPKILQSFNRHKDSIFCLFMIFVISLSMLPGISWIPQIYTLGTALLCTGCTGSFFCQHLISLCAKIHKNNWQTSKLIKWQSPYLATKDIRKRRNAGTALQGQKGF